MILTELAISINLLHLSEYLTETSNLYLDLLCNFTRFDKILLVQNQQGG